MSLEKPPQNIGELRAIVDKMDGTGDWKLFDVQSDNPNEKRLAIEHDNLRRAGFAAKAVLAFADTTFGGDNSGEDFVTVIGDLMGDLMHLCDTLEVDFGELVEQGAFHYEPELAGEL